MKDPFSGPQIATASREVKKELTVRLSSKRKKQLDALFAKWDFETKAYVRSILKPYFISKYGLSKPRFYDRFIKRKNNLEFLNDIARFKTWNERFLETGEKNSQKAYAKLLKKEVNWDDLVYLIFLLDEEMGDAVIPEEVADLIYKTYLLHLKKEPLPLETGLPKKPFILVVGPTGAGKTHTIKAAIEQLFSGKGIRVKKHISEERKNVIKDYPFWRRLPIISWLWKTKEVRGLEKEEGLSKEIGWYKWLVQINLFRKKASLKLKSLIKRGERDNIGDISEDEDSFRVNYATISPSDVQTCWHGETGDFFKSAMGDAGIPSIRHIIEAHGIFHHPKVTIGDDVQSRTLVAEVNRIMDEISDGARSCIMIADTHSPEDFPPDIYRRFDEKGIVIDISKFWRDKALLQKVIALELKQRNIRLPESVLKEITEKIFTVFNAKSLVITPPYVRKLVSSIVDKKGDIKPVYFDNEMLIRSCFESVARHSHGDLYKKIVKRPRVEEGYNWDDYQGSVKEDFLEKLTSTLFYGGQCKGLVMVGPPGSGKTYLAQVVGATHPEISYISVKPDDLYEEGQGYEGVVKNLDGVYNIAKMMAPTMIVINEADAVAKKRATSVQDPSNKVTNKILDILDGEESIRGTFTVMTSNLQEHLDDALTRPGRLEVMLVDGKLSRKDIFRIISRELKGEPRDKEVTDEEIYVIAKSVSNVPAGYVDFARTLKNIRKTEFNVIQDYRRLYEEARENLQVSQKIGEFVKFNAKAIIRVLETLHYDPKICQRAKKDIRGLTENKDLIYEMTRDIRESNGYKLKKSHLINAKIDLLKNPQQKALKGMEEFLSEELSTEPQVGKIVGAAYGNNRGFLVPINTNLISKNDASGDNIIVTGVTKGSDLQEIDYASMTVQSAKEALTLNIHYFQNILSSEENLKYLDAAAIVGSLLRDKAIHHQMESVHYTGGGPSAGFALSINTLSVLLNIPVYHDFGITGAPGTRGVSKDKAGSSVIIGGEDKKAERVLMDLRRMYVPKKNYDTIPLNQQESYWNEEKIIIPVGDYRDVIPETLYFGNESREALQRLIETRLVRNKEMMIKDDEADPVLIGKINEIKKLEEVLREIAELEIKRRLVSVYNFCIDPKRDEFSSLEAIFAKYDPLKR